jgi:hypothetical protein
VRENRTLRLTRRVMETELIDGGHRDLATAPLLDPTCERPAGKFRWSTHNECFNNLKNQGYHLEHSYGHGEKFLSFNFIILTMLAFYLHQFLEYRDELFQACRKKFGSKRHLWEKLSAYITLLVFNSFEGLLEFALNKDRYVGEQGLPLCRAGPSRALI